jgi:phasin protein
MIETTQHTPENATVMIGKLLGSAVDTQKELLAGLETIVAGWFERQRDALDSSARSLQKMYECRNLADLLRFQQDLVSAYLQWGVVEMRAAGRDTAQMTRKAATRLREGAGETAREKSAERVAAE